MRRASLNHTYRLVWSDVEQAFVAVAETCKGRGKGSGRKLAALSLTAALSLSAAVALAGPDGGQVVSGTGSISQSGTTTTIVQAGQNLSLSWKSFNVGQQETVNFVQPSASAIAVNRIYDTNGSQILGHLNANGQVYLINPNGILFGQGAQVNVGGLVASTLDLNDASLNGNSRTFSGTGTGSVINQGTINAAGSGYVALLGNHVGNQGTISAQLGSVAVGAGSAATLTFGGNSLVKMRVDQSVLNSLAENGGLIRADGGTVIMSAGAKDALLASVVNNSGVIEARTVENHEGNITLLGGMTAGTVNVGGTLDAGAPNGGNGGFVETSAAHVKVADGVKITTDAAHGQRGSWLIDPYDFTIAASGGDITGAALSAALGSTDVQIKALNLGINCPGANCGNGTSGSGNVNVNDSVTWNAHSLTLTAWNDIYINAPLNGSGTAGLALEYGMGAAAAGNTSNYHVNAKVNLASTGSFSTLLGNDGTMVNYTILTSLGAAGSNTGTDLQGMSGNLTAKYVLGSDIDASGTASWNSGAGFTTVGGGSGFSGIFDGLGHTITGLAINRPGSNNQGLFGFTNGATIRNVGLINANIHGNRIVGALVANLVSGTVYNSYATGAVTGNSEFVGGLVGADNFSSRISNSYANVTVTGGGDYVGGLLGFNNTSSTVSNSYATGTVAGAAGFVGGLVGGNNSTVSSSYSSGHVTGAASSSSVGGLVGGGTGTVSSSYWNKTTSGQTSSAGGLGRSAVQMRDGYENLDAFTFTSTPGGDGWVIVNNDGTLYNPADSSTYNKGATMPMLASEWSASISNAHQLQLMVMNKSASYTLANNIDATATNGKDVWQGSSFVAVGKSATKFTGRFDGLYHTIDGLTVIENSGRDYQGLFGYTDGATIRNVGLTNADIEGATSGLTVSYVGGLVGYAANSTVSNNYVTGTVKGYNYVGGLVGANDTSSTVSNSYATVAVTGGGGFVGGLVGYNISGTVSDSYATGLVSGGGFGVGGLIGGNHGTLTNGFWNKETSGRASSAGGGGLTSAQMQTLSTFSTWDIDDAGGTGKVWRIYDGYSTPMLRGFLTALTVTPAYDGSGTPMTNIAANTINGSYDSARVLGTASTLTLSSSTANGYTASLGKGLYSTQQGYDLVLASRTISTPDRAAGDIALSAPITWSSGTLNIATAGTITAGAAISGTGSAVFNLKNGTWRQVNSTLPAFGVYDFRISGGSFIRALGGDGTTNTPYQLTDIYGVQGMGSSGMHGLSYVLANDVDASGTANWNSTTGFTAVGDDTTAFIGSFDGQNRTMDGLTIHRSSSNYQGLFGQTTGATLSNVGLTNVNATGDSMVGGLVGYKSGGTVSNSYATGSVSGGTTIGGLVGYNGGGTVTGSHATGSVTGSISNVGGLIGNNIGTVSDSYATAVVSGTSSVGGLLGGNFGTVSNSYATGVVTGTSFSVGGLIGNNGGTVSASHATGSVSGRTNVGGLIGYSIGAVRNSYATGAVTGSISSVGGLIGSNAVDMESSSIGNVEGSYATGTVSSTGSSVGGLVGSNTGTVSGNHATGAVEGKTEVGGLIGNNSGTVSDNYATGATTGVITEAAGSAINIGGLVGKNATNGKVSRSYATGAVTGYQYVGGLVGKSYDQVEYSYATGAVTGDSYVGGLVGANGGGNTVSNSYATGSVTAALNNVGGLVGNNANSTIINSYSTGLVSGGSSNGIGGLVGNNFHGTVTNSFWDTQTSGQSTSDGGGAIGKTTAEMHTLSTFTDAGWDIDNAGGTRKVWRIYEGQTAPLLRTFLTPLTVTAKSGSKTYDGTAAGSGVSYNITPGSNLLGTAVTTISSKNVGSDYTVTASGLYTNQQGYDVSYSSGSLTITPKALTVGGITAANKVYDGGTTATVNTAAASLTGLISGDVLSVKATGTFADKNVATGKSVTLTSSYSGADVGNYSITDQAGTTANITPKALTVSGISASNKIYDGTTAATVNTAAASLTGLVSGDVLNVKAKGTFADKNVAAAKNVTIASSYSGADVGNYSITDQAGTTANITPKALSVSGISASDKVYDGTTTAAVDLTQASYTGLISGDVFAANVTGSFTDKNVGKTRTVSLTANFSGTDAGNYSVSAPASLTANITPKALSVSGISASDKVYDGTTTAAVDVTQASYNGLISGDVFAANVTGSFADKNVGKARTVSLTANFSGTDAGNYSVSAPASLTANITPKALSVSGITASDKVYDGTTTATLNTAAVSLNGLIAGDVLNVSANGAFGDKNVATAKTVSITSSYAGADVGNYAIGNQASTTANITAKVLTVTATGANKVYDGTTTGAVTLGDNRVANDVLTLGNTAANFSDKNVANGKTINVSGISVAGADAGNYTFNTAASSTASITPKTLSVSGITASDKVYDGSTAATVNTAAASYTGLIAGDVLNVKASGTFADKNVGTAKSVTLASSYSGADVGNYRITDQAGSSASISPATLTYSATPASFLAGQTPSGLSGSVNGFVSGDTLANSSSGSLAWTSPVTTTSPPAQYAINGAGLSAVNYVFTQDVGNASALSLKPGTPPAPVLNATTQLASNVFSPQAGTRPDALNLSPTITVTQGSSGDTSSSSSGSGTGTVVNVAMTIGRMGPALQIVNGGMRLPGNMAGVTE